MGYVVLEFNLKLMMLWVDFDLNPIIFAASFFPNTQIIQVKLKILELWLRKLQSMVLEG